MQHAAESFEVAREEDGARLDAALARRLGVSRAEVRALLARGCVSVAGRRAGLAQKGERLAAGQRVEVAAFTPRASQQILARAEPPRTVLARGPGWIALDKPPGVPVRPRSEQETGTLANFAAALHPEMQGVGEGGLTSGIVHRLDVDTSGVVLLASDAGVWRRLRAAFRHHKVSKTYRAIALGSPAMQGRADLWLLVASHRPALVRVVDAAEPGARRTRLAWRLLEHLRGACLLEIELETGFLHQIRATLAHLGASVAGDRLYGPPAEADPSGAPRQMLHAARVAFEEIDVSSPDPPDFQAALARLRDEDS